MSEEESSVSQDWLTTVAWHVHDLVRLPAGLERFQENIWRWYLHVKIRNSEMKGWEIRRDEHIDTVLASPRLRDKAAGPPRYLGMTFLASQPEWEWWEATRPINVEWRIISVAGWAPSDLNYSDEPKRYRPLPLTRRALRTEEKYTLLAAIHDHFCKGVKRIGPWPVLHADAESRRDVDEGLLYVVLYHRDVTTDLKAEDRPAIEAFLRDVEVDLRKSGEDVKERTSSGNATERPPDDGSSNIPDAQTAIVQLAKRVEDLESTPVPLPSPNTISNREAANLYADLADTVPNPAWIGKLISKESLVVEADGRTTEAAIARHAQKVRRNRTCREGAKSLQRSKPSEPDVTEQWEHVCPRCSTKAPKLVGADQVCRDCFFAYYANPGIDHTTG